MSSPELLPLSKEFMVKLEEASTDGVAGIF